MCYLRNSGSPAATRCAVMFVCSIVAMRLDVPMEARAVQAIHPGVLRFCVCPNAMPRAGRSADGKVRGADIAVAKLLAQSLDRRCEFHWCGTDSCRLQSLKDRRCDVVIGLPQESVESPDIAWTQPYAAGKFDLVVKVIKEDGTSNGNAGNIRSLIDLRGKRVGIVAGTVPLPQADHKVVSFLSREALLRGFKKARLDGALVDTDFTAWYLQEHPQLELQLVDEFVSQYRWNMGMVVRASDTALLAELSQVIESCLRRAKFQPLFAKVGLVYRAPLVDAPQQMVTGDTWERLQQGGTLVASMDPANLPYSSADPEQPGFDVEIAHALGKELDVAIQIKWIDVHRETAIGQLLEDECDLAFGAAVDPNAMNDEEELAGKVIYSRPYYGTGYFLVARKGAKQVQSLIQLQGEKSRRLGTQAGTVADYTLRQRGYLRRLFGTQLAVLTSLNDGGIDYGYLWSNVGWLLQRSPDFDAVLLSDFIPEDRWNIAIAMRHGDVLLKEHVDRALEKVVRKGVVKRTMKRYHTPYFAPFDGKRLDAAGANKTTEVGKSLLSRAPKDRGLEPQMASRQRSRQSYSDLQNIQARGTLIVGLDQNNLPFSTTHPEPAGLDYEVAQLLAEKIGVSLEIYWAYSSHDSYPAKLAHKKLCDVILGVMPDDRFAQRVTYSEPYSYASYQYVLSADNKSIDLERALATEVIALESGIAVRGLTDRQLKRYSSLESILDAVAAGRIQAGYVISSRAHWLAAEKWPGQLQFAQPKSEIDCFPICVALRRGETELREEINSAFRQLRHSGQLEQAFMRWHVPLGASSIHSDSPQ